MSKLPLCAAVLVLAASAGVVRAQDIEETAKRGAAAYRLCAACHSLQRGVHLSGPSLANMWRRRAATLTDFARYTDALKKSEIVWDEITLYAWIADPQAMVPGTTMTFRGIENGKTREDLVAFLRLALAPNGADEVVQVGMLPVGMAHRTETP